MLCVAFSLASSGDNREWSHEGNQDPLSSKSVCIPQVPSNIICMQHAAARLPHVPRLPFRFLFLNHQPALSSCLIFMTGSLFPYSLCAARSPAHWQVLSTRRTFSPSCDTEKHGCISRFQLPGDRYSGSNGSRVAAAASPKK